MRRVLVAAAVLAGAAAAPTVLAAPAQPETRNVIHDSRIADREAESSSRALIRSAQARLAGYGYSVAIDGIAGAQTGRALRHWQAANALAATGVLDAATLDSLDVAATATTVAVRTDPPPPAAAPTGPPPFDGAGTGPATRAGRCTGAEALLAYYSPGWDVVHMSHVMRGESMCNPRAYNRGGHAHGLLQITPITFAYLAEALGTTITPDKLFDPAFNIRAAAALYRQRGYQPWALR